jgi:hypothetical protein
MVRTPTSLSPQEIFSSAYLAKDMGLGDVKHHEFSNLHNLKIQSVLCTLKIFFSLFCNMRGYFALYVIQVKIKESTVKTQSEQQI